MVILNIQDIPKGVIDDIKLNIEEHKYDIYIDTQTTGFGEKRFFICPLCLNKRTKLYLDNGSVGCRNCLNYSPYKGIQNTTRGGYSYIEYKMETLAAKHNIKFEYPFRYYKSAFDKPKYMRFNKWEEVIRKLLILENMRNQAIFFNKKYTAKLIRHTLENCLYMFSMKELDENWYDWGAIVNQTINRGR